MCNSDKVTELIDSVSINPTPSPAPDASDDDPEPDVDREGPEPGRGLFAGLGSPSDIVPWRATLKYVDGSYLMAKARDSKGKLSTFITIRAL